MTTTRKTIVLAILLIFTINVTTAQNKVDDNGKKQGEWIKKDKKGRLVYKGQFKDDYPVDTFYYYDNKGNIELKNYFSHNGTHTYSWFVYANGVTKAEGKYINKKKEGQWIYYSPKGVKITQENYKNNLKDGEEKKWETKGKDIIEVTNYVQGVKQGKYFKTLYSDGYYITNYKDNQFDGEYKEYYANKSLKVKGQFVKDKKQGTWEVYDASGKCVQKLFYEDDVFKGDLIRFDTEKGVKEIAQKEIAMMCNAGKQTKIVLLNGEKLNVMNSLASIIPLTSVIDFVQVNEKKGIYLNVAVIEGLNSNKSVKTKIDLGMEIFPDTDGLKLVQSMTRTEFDK